MTPTRAQAWRLLTEYTQNDRLLKHGLGVEAAVRGYARRFGEDEETWGSVALLHDFDYERWPSAEDHPYRGCEILRAQDYPEYVMRAILSHADYTGVPRESKLEHTLKRSFTSTARTRLTLSRRRVRMRRMSVSWRGSWRSAPYLVPTPALGFSTSASTVRTHSS